ncbi:MAG TPA: 16S rRNA (adenine(1518)-N(6)/adenine(1519)-N(6))-dimethyltransferase RsmA [Candidatus Accumulibacter phosphatis]|nr:MAG: Ribosomal RNA small subunit methyltransferase A [Candidatus Accumulibacter sp. SK-11]HAY29378.1 16S rRNA (adenine(1518)-N(6)/adenine(1519)-N(6))-dimethyltransferase RsmA [Accumulibacter sp.]HRL75750.1 16S rRNA (adenine(1518)-N(6)/adenine(1519)-N(6))-dimethyltransferase RsmA [Candidatus Accumulibacter phosphatis]HCN70148.1 16S rRNA (adenine(1518)-N(6)/adenine(1519)-N(6))-dimethyltransferase RsmA [Accumulibacter sp.]HCV12882.1 16S rRNA (adenine(1518)-N(6)/adenine(1519)-N(6))-dimethyltrans
MRPHRARKRFGQHFLVDPQVIDDIVGFLAVQRGDRVVEIGPGLGALTAPLLQRLDHLHVVEIDRDIIAHLQRRYPAGSLTIHAGDALLFDFADLASAARGCLRIVGNLPYNISTPLLFHLASFAGLICDMHFMLQREVVERMVAAPGSSAFGRLSVMLQYRFCMEALRHVPPEAFDPAPRVESTVVRLLPRPPEQLTARDEGLFAALVAAAFAQRRKMLRNSLDGLVEESQLAALGLASSCRAQELSVADFVRLANSLQP